MCAVSAITDYYRDKWYIPPVNPYLIPMEVPVVPHIYISPTEWEEYKKLKKIMEIYDKQTGQPDCVKPEVGAWEKVIEDIIKQQESGNVVKYLRGEQNGKE